MKLGINGYGRIGKLTLWHHIENKFFDEIIVNIGRETGTKFEDIIHYTERDSTYGFLKNYLYGTRSGSVITNINKREKKIVIDGIKVKFLTNSRNPYKIDWKKNYVKIVIDKTGQFLDQTLPEKNMKCPLKRSRKL